MNKEQAVEIRRGFTSDLRSFSNPVDQREWRDILRADPQYQEARDIVMARRRILHSFRDKTKFDQGVFSEADVIKAEIKSSSLILSAYSASLPDAREKRWGHLLDLYEGSKYFLIQLRRFYEEDQNQADNSLATRAVDTGMVLAARLLAFDTFRDIKVILKAKPNRAVEHAILLREFINCAPLQIGDGERTLADLYETDFSKKGVDSSVVVGYFSLIMQLIHASQARIQEDRLWEVNDEGFGGQNPYFSRNALREAQEIAISLYQLRPKMLRASNELILIESFKKTDKLLTNYDHLKSKISQLLFSPGEPGFEMLKELFVYYLNLGNKSISTFLFSIANGGDIGGARRFLRKARQLAVDPENGEFYSLLADKLEELVEHKKDNVLPSVDDLDEVIDERENIGEGIVIGDVRKMVSSITSIPGWKNIDINNLDFSWRDVGMKRPDSLSFQFSKDNPFIIKMSLDYKDIDDPFTVDIDVNTARGFFDWSLREDPTLYPTYQSRFLLIVKNILEEIQEKAREEFESRRKKHTVSVEIPRQKRTRPQQGERVRVTRIKEVITPIKLALAEDIGELQEPEPIYAISLPDESEYAALMGGIPVDDQRLIDTKLKDYMAVGKGKFRQLKAPGPNGERQFRLRAGHYRIIFYEKSPGVNVLHLDVIRHRDGVYRAIDRR